MSEDMIRRGPGRPRNDSMLNSAQTHAQAAIDRPNRPNRKPFGSFDLKLAYPDRQGFHRHWFNDTPGRIERAIEAGYTHVKNGEKPVSRIVGSAEGGGALHAFLMEIPEEWYKEDMAKEQALITEKEEMMMRGKGEGEAEGQYVPKQGISIRHG